MRGRLRAYHDFCRLSSEAQVVVTDVIRWLHRTRAETRAEVVASLDALAAGPVTRSHAWPRGLRARPRVTVRRK